MLSDYDFFLLGQGNHHRSYDVLGAHVLAEPWPAARFAVWAPHARRVSVVGDFNGWDAARHPMAPAGGFGVWAAFVLGATPGQRYKYRLETATGAVEDRADPYAFAAELRPGTASVLHVSRHGWSDEDWITQRARADPLAQPISSYEVHLGSWRRVPEQGYRSLTYRELAVQLVDYVKPLGFTHLELLPITEHPFDGS